MKQDERRRQDGCRRRRLLSCLVFLSTLSVSSWGELAVNWFKIAGGASLHSTGGVYSVSGTIGQHDAGSTMTGGSYSLTGGFWSVTAMQTLGAPRLSIAQTNGVVTVSWPNTAGGWVLEKIALVPGTLPPWSQVPSEQYQTNATDIYVAVSPPTGNVIFRLHKASP